MWGIIHSLHYVGMMNEEEVEQLFKLNKKVFNGETLTEQQETLRCQYMNLRRAQPGNLISRYLLSVYEYMNLLLLL